MRDNIFSLPKNIQFYITCNKGFDVREQIYDQYNVNNLAVLEPVINALEDFYLMKINAKQLLDVFKKLPLESSVLKAFTLDFFGKFLLVFDVDYNNQISSVIKSLGGNVETFKDDVEALVNEWKVYKEELYEEGTIDTTDDDEINIEEEKKDILGQFEADLSPLLYLESEESNFSVQGANFIIGYLLFNQPDLKDDLLNILTNNQTNLTEYFSTSEDEGLQPTTVADWLADYLSFSGGRFNDNLMAARYVIESPYIKKLSDEDKTRVKNLISLYRNLYNFPDNFDVQHPENTQFFPIDVLKIRFGKFDEAEEEDAKETPIEVVEKIVTPSVKEETVQVVKNTEVVKDSAINKAGIRYQTVINSITAKNEIIKLKDEMSSKSLTELITEWRGGYAKNNPALCVASLIELFKKPNFSAPWFNTPEIREVLSAQVVAYPSLAEPTNREGVINVLVVVVVVKALLQRLGFNEEQSAVLFLQIANHEPKMASFVYFDSKVSKFAWRQFTDK